MPCTQNRIDQARCESSDWFSALEAIDKAGDKKLKEKYNTVAMATKEKDEVISYCEAIMSLIRKVLKVIVIILLAGIAAAALFQAGNVYLDVIFSGDPKKLKANIAWTIIALYLISFLSILCVFSLILYASGRENKIKARIKIASDLSKACIDDYTK